jgi:putative Mg2+ transporter-C (MgtC) family protein
VISLPDVTEVAMRLGAATLIGAAVGLNREMRHRPAGLKTHALVGLGAALITSVTAALTSIQQPDIAALSRAIQGIIAGIGFLGGGAILKDGDEVHGITTAATIWVVAALGIGCGAGFFASAMIAMVIALLVLVVGNRIEEFVQTKRSSQRAAPPQPSGSGPERP